jgi:5-methylcytosine-specific restriction protein B
MADDDSDKPYPAKATVVVAVGHLPGERVLSSQEFFNGYGDMQCRAVLEKLGYRILSKEADDQSPALSRDRIEAAMDAFEAFRQSGAHADALLGFGAPSDHWVRTTKPRKDKRFPTKPLIGVLLGKPASALTGGWSQSHDAAARLHAATPFTTMTWRPCGDRWISRASSPAISQTRAAWRAARTSCPRISPSTGS